MAGVKQPSDKSHFLLPDLGEGLVEAELISWKVKAGDTVKESQTLAEMQTDKALVEVPSPWAGTVTEITGKPGDIIKVGAVLVRYGAAKAAAPAPVAVAAAAASSNGNACMSSQIASGAPAAEGDQGTVVGTMSGTLTVSDRFARRAPEAAVAVRDGKAMATPAVRGLAKKFGVDIQKVPGSGRGGRVTASDVASFAEGGVATMVEPSSAGVAGFAPRAATIAPGSVYIDQNDVAQRVPFRGVRRKIAEALSRSVQTAVHFTVVDEADVTALEAKRREYSKVVGEKLSMLPFIMTAICRGLKKHPSLNAVVDDAKGEIILKSAVNLGCAVDTDAGLMVPVIRNAGALAPVQMSQSVKTLAAKCKDRTIAREDSLGGTFTISNVGSYGGMFATPVINYPEVAILAAGRAKERVCVKDGKFYAGLVLPLSLSCDHRVVDGAEGARFLNTVVKLLEDPDALLS
ncbi:MAG: dihydrolipoamide acetyltransferase family protein [Planctomycetota bacterium]|nr:dihydrolipoamide acetyltransferase family protein [Planctomycetota bacterium]